MYQLRGRLGRWGIGEIYEAVHKPTGNLVMLKLVRGRRAGDPKVRSRMMEEYNAATALDHEGILKINEIDEPSELGLCHVMDLMPGATLGDELKKGQRYSAEKTCAMAIEAAEALSALHSAGLAHNELCPHSIFLPKNRSGREFGLKLINFGLPPATDKSEPRPQLPLEALPYAAPERRAGNDWGSPADIYSICSILVQLVTGRRPPPQGWKQVPQLPDGKPPLARDLIQVAAKGLEKDPERRHAAVDDLVAALRLCSPSGPVKQGSPEPEPAARPSKDKPEATPEDRPVAPPSVKKTVMGMAAAGSSGKKKAPPSVKKTVVGIPAIAAPVKPAPPKGPEPKEARGPSAAVAEDGSPAKPASVKKTVMGIPAIPVPANKREQEPPAPPQPAGETSPAKAPPPMEEPVSATPPSKEEAPEPASQPPPPQPEKPRGPIRKKSAAHIRGKRTELGIGAILEDELAGQPAGKPPVVPVKKPTPPAVPGSVARPAANGASLAPPRGPALDFVKTDVTEDLDGGIPLDLKGFGPSGTGGRLALDDDLPPESEAPVTVGRTGRRWWFWFAGVGVFLMGAGALALVIIEPWEKSGGAKGRPAQASTNGIPPAATVDGGTPTPRKIDATAATSAVDARPSVRFQDSGAGAPPSEETDGGVSGREPAVQQDAGSDPEEDRPKTSREKYKEYMALGRRALKKRKYALARKFFTKALKIRRGSSRAQRYMAEAHYKAREWWAAVFWYKKTLKSSPRSASLHVRIGKAYAKVGKRSVGCKHFLKALRLRPNSKSYRRNVENYRCR